MSNRPKLSILDIAILTAMVLAPWSTASGQVVQTFGEVQGRLQRGEEVYVSDGAGREIRGAVLEISASSVQLLVDGKRRDFDAVNVRRVDRVVRDPLKNGILWGLAVGAGAGFLGMVAARDSVTLDDAGVAVALALIVAPLAGAAVGAGIDASRTTREPVYARTTPRSSRLAASLGLSAGHVGIAIRVRF